MNIWYEVYKSDADGSQTLKICKDYPEAKEEKEKLKMLYGEHVYIDKWTNKENPRRLKVLE